MGIARGAAIALGLMLAAPGAGADTGIRSTAAPAWFPGILDRPLEYEYFGWAVYRCELKRVPYAEVRIAGSWGEGVPHLEIPPGQTVLSLKGFLFWVSPQEVKIYRPIGRNLFAPYAAFPRSLAPGMPGSSGVGSGQEGRALRRSYAVTAERRVIRDHAMDTLRIDFSGPDGGMESLWLARGIGIVGWKSEGFPTPLELVSPLHRGAP